MDLLNRFPGIKAPVSDYENFHDEAKYLVFFRIVCFTIISNSILFFLNLLFENYTFSNVLLVSLVLEFLVFTLIYKTKKYEAPAMIFVGLHFFKFIIAIYLYNDIYYLIFAIWAIISISVISIIIHNKYTILLLVSLIAISSIFINKIFILEDDYDIEKFRIITWINLIVFLLNYVFVVYQNKQMITYTIVNLSAAQEALNNQYQLIRKQNQENTTLLKEIHHRVKNNLQLVSSLLRLQSHSVKSQETKDCLNDAVNRVKAMSIVHEKMYQSDDLSGIQLSEYFDNLIEELKSYYPIIDKISITSKLEIDFIEMKKIVPISLIFNELFTNSVKHAFTFIENPKIAFSFQIMDDGLICFSYSDNGTWKIKESDDSFGLELIDDFISQLDAKKEFVVTSNCTTYRIYYNN